MPPKPVLKTRIQRFQTVFETYSKHDQKRDFKIV